MAMIVEELKPRDPADMGPFKLLARLGSGGFGTVYAASLPVGRGQGLTLDELVAVKVVQAHIADVKDFRDRFAEEIEAIKRVKCDFVPRFVDADVADDPPWLATNLIPGLALDKVIRNSGPLPERAVWHLAGALAEILMSIHASHVVHRDFKPQNVLMVPTGPWVIDFSLVHLAELAHKSSSRMGMASFRYAAPEQLNRLRDAGFPADVYALGATLVFAATGHPPFDGATAAQVIHSMLTERPDLSGLPRGLYHLVNECLQYSQDQRPTLAEVLMETDQHTGGVRREGFPKVLPPDMLAQLSACHAEVAVLTGEITPVPPVPLDEAEPDEPRFPRGYEPATRKVASPLDDSPGLLARIDDRQLVADSVLFSDPMPSAGSVPSGDGVVVDPVLPAWSRALGDWICAPLTVDRDLLVAACLNGTVTARRVADGLPVAEWQGPARLGSAVHSSALLSPHGGMRGTAYVGTASGRVHAIDMVTGKDRVVVEADAPIEGSLVTVRDHVYALSADGLVHAVDPFTDQWTVLTRLGRAVTGSPGVTSDGKILVADVDGVIHAVDVARGRAEWRLRTDGLVLATPVQSLARLYVGGTDGVVREVGIPDGREHARDKVDAPIHVSPVAADGRLYVGTSDGVVHAYDTTQPGRVRMRRLWRFSLGEEEIGGLSVSDGRLFVTAGCRVMELDAFSGRWGREWRRLPCLIGAAPVLVAENCFITGLGGIAECLTVG